MFFHVVGDAHGRTAKTESRSEMARDVAKVKLRKDGKPFASSRGRRNPPADQSNWRIKLDAKTIKFDDLQKDVFINALARTGRKSMAAAAADVTTMTVARHLEFDPDFSESVDLALDAYKDMISTEVVRRGVVGWEEPIFHKGERVVEPILNEDGSQLLTEDGKPMMRYTTITKFSDRMLELEAKRADPEYREKQTIDLNQGGGGVLVAPAGQTPEQEIAEAEKVNAEAVAKREKEAREAMGKTK